MGASDEIQQLAERVRAALTGVAISEKLMFGGITFLLDGNMPCCVSNKGLMVRVGKEAEPDALGLPHARPCDGAGHKMPGFVTIAPEGLRGDRDLAVGLGLALRYVSALPPKARLPKATSRRPRLLTHTSSD